MLSRSPERKQASRTRAKYGAGPLKVCQRENRCRVTVGSTTHPLGAASIGAGRHFGCWPMSSTHEQTGGRHSLPDARGHHLLGGPVSAVPATRVVDGAQGIAQVMATTGLLIDLDIGQQPKCRPAPINAAPSGCVVEPTVTRHRFSLWHTFNGPAPYFGGIQLACLRSCDRLNIGGIALLKPKILSRDIG